MVFVKPIFLEQFLGSQQNWEKGSPITSITHQSGVFVTKGEPTLIDTPLPPKVHGLPYVRPWCGVSCGLGLIHPRHYIIIQSIFTALKILCALLVYPLTSW